MLESQEIILNFTVPFWMKKEKFKTSIIFPIYYMLSDKYDNFSISSFFQVL